MHFGKGFLGKVCVGIFKSLVFFFHFEMTTCISFIYLGISLGIMIDCLWLERPSNIFLAQSKKRPLM